MYKSIEYCVLLNARNYVVKSIHFALSRNRLSNRLVEALLKFLSADPLICQGHDIELSF
jgi:hypothetical protein